MAFPKIGRVIDVHEDSLEKRAHAYDFRGIVALSNCSGSIVRFDDSLDTDQAMVLTNGHCISMITPGVALPEQVVSRSFSVLNKTGRKVGRVNAERLLYGAMTKTDMGLYRLKETYQDIQASFNVSALTLSREAPAVDAPIEVISGYWVRGYSCAIESIVPTLEEGDWYFQDSLRYSRPGCAVIGGTSGSPVLAAGTRTVVAVNNTINESGAKCEENNPCEIAADGTVFAAKGYAYAQNTFWLYSCRNAAGLFDVKADSCGLLKPGAARSH